METDPDLLNSIKDNIQEGIITLITSARDRKIVEKERKSINKLAA
jgi:hypothetical protein